MHQNHDELQSHYDAVIVGAGVIGSAAAVMLAKEGKRCLLLEAAPDAVRRYAGEWMHPTVAALMAQLGIEKPKAAAHNDAGAGFMVHPEDGTGAIELKYPEGQRGFCCSHYDLSVGVREQAIAHPNVHYVPFARVIDVSRDGRLRFHVAESLVDREVSADLVVGAEGRSSVCRRSLVPDTNRNVVSYMAALTLPGSVAVPTEGYGHIFMGAPGLVLSYRVSPDEVRVCLDVPADRPELRRDVDALYREYQQALPSSLHAPVLAALHDKSLRWTATFFQPRTMRGADRIVLVGDAVGLCHPLCSAGVAVGLLDVALLQQAVREGDLNAYRRNGAKETWVPELMSCAVYQLLGRPEVSVGLRQAIYKVWRDDPLGRAQTLNILTGAERTARGFIGSIASVGAKAVSSAVRQRVLERAMRVPRRDTQRPSVLAQAKTLGQWARWPVASALPSWVVDRIRPQSTIDAPF